MTDETTETTETRVCPECGVDHSVEHEKSINDMLMLENAWEILAQSNVDTSAPFDAFCSAWPDNVLPGMIDYAVESFKIEKSEALRIAVRTLIKAAIILGVMTADHFGPMTSDLPLVTVSEEEKQNRLNELENPKSMLERLAEVLGVSTSNMQVIDLDSKDLPSEIREQIESASAENHPIAPEKEEPSTGLYL